MSRPAASPTGLVNTQPTLRWLTRTPHDIAQSATTIADALALRLAAAATVEIIDCESQIGSGALPTRTVPSVGLAIAPASTIERTPGTWLATLAAGFRRLDTPVIGRIHDDRFILDLRCLDDVAGFIANIDDLEPPA